LFVLANYRLKRIDFKDTLLSFVSSYFNIGYRLTEA
jgi:hypothetical protein